ncbi:MAG: acyl-CoA dehydrogenase family protein [Gemmatimonadetes bacterium]|nr:acyl-CoA dehydrogenase family protein [Gemmatimonadota bacterium]
MATPASVSGASFLTRATDPPDMVTPDDLGEEERMLVQAVQDFAEREVVPVMDKLVARDPATSRRLFKKAAELGIFMAEVPEADGGLDLNVLAVTGMLAIRADMGPLVPMIMGHQGIGTLPMVFFGTPEQKEKYLGRCMEGDILSAFALTEPGTGSDAMNIQTKAVLDPDGTHYVINGSKQWITNAGWADLFVLFAKIDGEHFTAFLVDRDTPGLTVAEPERLLGQHGSSVCALSLEDVRVPVENVLGEIAKGHKVAFCTLNMGRLKLSASSATGAKVAVEVAAKYAAERVQFGLPIARFGLIQRKLADMAARAYAAESVAYRTAGLVYHALERMKEGGGVTAQARLDTLSEFSVECALAKVYATEAYNGNADDAVQVFGGYGFSEEYKPARMYRDSRVSRIYEGTNEICRLYAQRTIFKKLSGGEGGGGVVSTGLDAFKQLHAMQQTDPSEGAPSMLEAVTGLKQAYLLLMEEVVTKVGPANLKDPARQQFLASLADIAMETYAAETAALRVAKLEGRGGPEERAVRDALARLVQERSTERVRAEARTILGELHAGEDGARRLAEIDALLPAPQELVGPRTRVSEWLVAHDGMLPGEVA